MTTTENLIQKNSKMYICLIYDNNNNMPFQIKIYFEK